MIKLFWPICSHLLVLPYYFIMFLFYDQVCHLCLFSTSTIYLIFQQYSKFAYHALLPLIFYVFLALNDHYTIFPFHDHPLFLYH